MSRAFLNGPMARLSGDCRHFVEDAPCPIFITDRVGRIQSWNAACTEVLGMAGKMGWSVQSLIDVTDEEEPVGRLISRVVDEGTSFSVAATIESSGEGVSHRTTTLHLFPLRDEAGRVQGCTWIVGNRTTRKEAEPAAFEHDPEGRKLLDAANAILWRGDPHTFSFSYVSKAAEDLLGYPVERWTEDPVFWQEHLHPEDRKRVIEFCTRATRKLEPHEIEYRMIASDGRVVWLRDVVNVLASGGEPQAMVGVMMDITQRKRAEQERRDVEAKFQSLVEQALSGVYIIQDGEFAYANERLADIFGYTREEIVESCSVEDLVYEADRERVVKTIRRRIEGETEEAHYTFRGQRKDGEVIHVEVHGGRSQYEGRPAVTGMLLDVTEQKEMEEELQRHRKLLATISEHVTDGIFRIMPEEGLVDANQAFVNMFRYDTLEEMKALPVSVLYTEPEKHRETRQALRQTGHCRGKEVKLERKDGTSFWGLLNMTADQDPEGHTVYDGAVADITQLKRHEAELIRAKEEAEEMNRLKSAFLENMSHEIRTPLTSIIGFSDILEEEVEGEPRRFAQMIQQNGERLMGMLNSVLDLAQLEGGTMELQPEPVDVVEQVHEVMASFRSQVDEAQVSLRVEAPDRRIEIYIDQDAFYRVLSNLVSNAVKFTPEGEIITTVRKGNAWVEVSVRDTGIGIASAFQEELFDEFKQESLGVARTFEGSGLGLAITKRLVDLLEGTIEVESEPGVGSTFTVRFPTEQPG